jgi:putative oxidoreductase
MFDVSDNSVIGFYAQQRRRSKALNITFKVLQTLLAATFLIAGALKHAGTINFATFEKLGLGQWSQYFIGGLEMISAILIVVRRTAAPAAAVLSAIMIAAIVTHLFILGPPPISAIVLLVATAAVAWYRGVYE